MPQFIVPAAASIAASYFANRSDTSKQQPYMDALNKNAGSQSSLANSLERQGGKVFSLSYPAFTKALDHYQTLLSGNRGAVGAYMSPIMQQVNDTYKGAATGIERGAMRGGERDQALAGLKQQQAGQVGGAQMSMMPAAAQGLSGLAQSGLGTARDYGSIAGYTRQGGSATYNDLLQNQQAQDKLEWERASQTGSSLMQLLAGAYGNMDQGTKTPKAGQASGLNPYFKGFSSMFGNATAGYGGSSGVSKNPYASLFGK
jgi:hypothetical protein